MFCHVLGGFGVNGNPHLSSPLGAQPDTIGISCLSNFTFSGVVCGALSFYTTLFMQHPSCLHVVAGQPTRPDKHVVEGECCSVSKLWLLPAGSLLGALSKWPSLKNGYCYSNLVYAPHVLFTQQSRNQ